jgi:hypothetical protein
VVKINNRPGNDIINAKKSEIFKNHPKESNIPEKPIPSNLPRKKSLKKRKSFKKSVLEENYEADLDSTDNILDTETPSKEIPRQKSLKKRKSFKKTKNSEKENAHFEQETQIKVKTEKTFLENEKTQKIDDNSSITITPKRNLKMQKSVVLENDVKIPSQTTISDEQIPKQSTDISDENNEKISVKDFEIKKDSLENEIKIDHEIVNANKLTPQRKSKRRKSVILETDVKIASESTAIKNKVSTLEISEQKSALAIENNEQSTGSIHFWSANVWSLFLGLSFAMARIF